MDLMYAAKINSPSTTIASGVDEVSTSIVLVDTSVLPAAPNICTIGIDADAETVSYSAINGNTLTCVRGFQGTAKSWVSGTEVCRAFTAYDHDTFVNNITELSEGTAAVPNTRTVNAKELSADIILTPDDLNDTATAHKFVASADVTKLNNLSNTNSGDETLATIKTKLGITTLSGSNTGDETLTTIKTKLGITTLSGSNTGDQTLAGLSGAAFRSGSNTFALGSTTYTVYNAFITASTMVIISPALTKLGIWSVSSAAGSFTVTSDTLETENVTFDWGAIK